MKQYSAKYFEKTSIIIEKFLPSQIVTLQFFQRADDVVLCGINEVLSLLKNNTDTSKYQIKYLPEGSVINKNDIVLELQGQYQLFGFLEGIIDGILVRQSSIATNASLVKKAAKNKAVVFMGDRADHYLNQANDGYAASIGGIQTQVTDAQVSLHNGLAVGTIPHALIQMFGGDLIKALHAYNETFPNEDLTALVDFNNDVITDSLLALKEFGPKLKALRVDTSANMSDLSFKDDLVKDYGVSVRLIKNLRDNLDKNNGKHVKIIVSSGFDYKKINEFEMQNVPVDVYGVGASILKINLNFTCDATKIGDKLIAKAGREYRPIVNFKIFK